MREYKIYKLVESDTMRVRYVGATVQRLSQRFAQHKHEALKMKFTHKRHWLRKLFTNNIPPKIELIELTNEVEWENRESYWIDYYGLENLTNARKGGSGMVFKKDDSINRSAIGHYKPIVMLDLNLNYIREFESIKSAAKYLNCGLTSITEGLSGRCLTARNYHFVHKDKYNENYTIDLSTARTNVLFSHIEVRMLNGELLIFNRINEVSQYFKVSSSFVSMWLNNTRKFNKYNIKSIKKIYYDIV